MTINCYAAHEARAPLERWQYAEADLDPHGVEIAISHCGICHSDVHLVDNDWKSSTYPLVPGHEIIGTVKAVGSAVSHLTVGQRVGVGWQRTACLNCEQCMTGFEQQCDHSQDTCVGNYGGFAERIRTDSRFAFPIPDGLASETAAPLLCAGVTVYSPLSRYAKHTSRVGVIGIGGLGHLALQFAAKMGCEVTAFSSTAAKEDEARHFGASRFVASADSDAMKGIRGSLDVIISTVTANLKWSDYLRALRTNGVLCFVGVPGERVSLHVGGLMDNQANVTASGIGGRGIMTQMLDFAARHNIVAQTEVLPMDNVNDALDRLRRNDVRYRFVLTT